jgi:2-oxoglutarate ferredoxin oxidoreductase subunit alpha
VADFANSHEHVFVVEQNRDGQLRMLLVNEAAIDSTRLSSVLHYDGTPITARFIRDDILERLTAFQVTPLRLAKADVATGE